MFKGELSHSLVMPIKAVEMGVLSPRVSKPISSVSNWELLSVSPNHQWWPVYGFTKYFFTGCMIGVRNNASQS